MKRQRIGWLALIACCNLLLFALVATTAQETCTPTQEATELAQVEVAQVQLGVLLNMRATPSIRANLRTTLEGGTNLIIRASATCADGYRWWMVESFATDNLESGWVAEGTRDGETAFILARGERVQGDPAMTIRTLAGFEEPLGCARPPEDYDILRLNGFRLNERTILMLEQAERVYERGGGDENRFRQAITQGSYNPGGVAASFGTHDGGGAVDLSVRSFVNFEIMRDELQPMIDALRIAGFAAWVRETDELFSGSAIHIHAIAVGDAEHSPVARQQVVADFGYFAGYNGLPPSNYSADGVSPLEDRYGPPVICAWMIEDGWVEAPTDV